MGVRSFVGNRRRIESIQSKKCFRNVNFSHLNYKTVNAREHYQRQESPLYIRLWRPLGRFSNQALSSRWKRPRVKTQSGVERPARTVVWSGSLFPRVCVCVFYPLPARTWSPGTAARSGYDGDFTLCSIDSKQQRPDNGRPEVLHYPSKWNLINRRWSRVETAGWHCDDTRLETTPDRQEINNAPAFVSERPPTMRRFFFSTQFFSKILGSNFGRPRRITIVCDQRSVRLEDNSIMMLFLSHSSRIIARFS